MSKVKTKTKQSITLFIPVSQLDEMWKGDFDKLPANQTFNLIIDYPLGGARAHQFPIKTGKHGLGLIGLLAKIGQAYSKLYEDPDGNDIFGHDIDDLQLQGISVNFKTKKITLDIGS